MSSAELLASIKRDRSRFDVIVGRIPEHRLEEPVLPGGWSLKDVLAHIAWADRENTGVARARALSGSHLWELSDDERNAEVVKESRTQWLAQVMGEYRDSFSAYIAAMAELSDEELNEPERIANLTERVPGWLPWRILYDPDHYTDHGQAIEAAFGLGRESHGPIP